MKGNGKGQRWLRRVNPTGAASRSAGNAPMRTSLSRSRSAGSARDVRGEGCSAVGEGNAVGLAQRGQCANAHVVVTLAQRRKCAGMRGEGCSAVGEGNAVGLAQWLMGSRCGSC